MKWNDPNQINQTNRKWKPLMKEAYTKDAFESKNYVTLKNKTSQVVLFTFLKLVFK